jgi:uncharacterized protein YqeY
MQEMKQAMKDKDATRLSTVRLINAAIKDQDIALRGSGDDALVDDDAIMAILAKMIKQRQESARVYEEGGRLDLAERELAEIEIVRDFLPRQLDEAEVDEAISKTIADLGATSLRDMGKVIGQLKQDYKGQMDFSKVGPMVKDRLSN